MLIRTTSLASALLAMTAAAHAAPTDVVFKGGFSITSTSGCTNWNPAREFGVGTYWVPVPGSTNGTNSTVTFHFGNASAEGFRLNGDVFTSTFKTVDAVHVYTLIGTYSASARVTFQSPTTITTTTPRVTVLGAIKGWDRATACVVNFTMTLVRDLQP